MIQYLLWTAAVLIGAFTYDLFGFVGGDHVLPPGVATGVVLVGGVGFSVWWPRVRYRRWRYALRDEELYVEHGVLNRIWTIVPLRRVQHFDVSQNVLEREFDLGKLIVHTAGTQSSTVVVPGLPYPEAERLRDVVKAYVLDDAV